MAKEWTQAISPVPGSHHKGLFNHHKAYPIHAGSHPREEGFSQIQNGVATSSARAISIRGTTRLRPRYTSPPAGAGRTLDAVPLMTPLTKKNGNGFRLTARPAIKRILVALQEPLPGLIARLQNSPVWRLAVLTHGFNSLSISIC